MKKFFFVILCFISLAGFGQEVLPRPNPPRLVTDAANVLTPEQREILENKLVALDDSTSNQIAVVLIRSLGDYGIEEYAVKLFREWGIGNKKSNNGVLIIAAIDDKKIRIEVGYGLEGAIPDVIANNIIQQDIVPEFKQGNYYSGIDDAINSLAKAAVGEYKEKRTKNKAKDGSGSPLGFGLIIFVVFLVILISRNRRGGGGRNGGMMSRSGFGNVAEAIFLSSLLGGGGGSRGGGGWGGGGGGGGFGGFGGGSSGGGGASGSW